MTDNQILISFKIDSLRWKYKKNNDKVNSEILDRIFWYSYPIVYPEWENDLKCLYQAKKARKQKKKRVKKYIQNMFASYHAQNLYFVTFKFPPKTYKTKENTRYQYVARYLNQYADDYYCNIDYGAENGREHYHAVVATHCFMPYDNKKLDIKVKPIKFQSAARLSKYILKLSNHATKLSTGRSFHKRGMREVDELPF